MYLKCDPYKINLAVFTRLLLSLKSMLVLYTVMFFTLSLDHLASQKLVPGSSQIYSVRISGKAASLKV